MKNRETAKNPKKRTPPPDICKNEPCQPTRTSNPSRPSRLISILPIPMPLVNDATVTVPRTVRIPPKIIAGKIKSATSRKPPLRNAPGSENLTTLIIKEPFQASPDNLILLIRFPRRNIKINEQRSIVRRRPIRICMKADVANRWITGGLNVAS